MVATRNRTLSAALAFGLIVTAMAAMTAMTTAAKAADTASMQDKIRTIEHAWAHVMYQMKDDDQKEKQLASLAAEAEKLVAAYPDRAEPLVWDGVITSSEARYSGMFSALGLAKRSRKMFEKAAKLDVKALDGAAPASLGTLYFMVPGFPIGFGDNDKARKYLEQAVRISPNGLDSNYFYADFLFHQEDYAKAAKALRKALKSPRHPDRPVWDAGRRGEALALLAKVERKMASNSSSD